MNISIKLAQGEYELDFEVADDDALIEQLRLLVEAIEDHGSFKNFIDVLKIDLMHMIGDDVDDTE